MADPSVSEPRPSLTGRSIPVGARAQVAGKLGTVKFAGPTQFAAGVWIGVALDEPVGKNNGVVKDVKYFECEPLHGIFVRQAAITLVDDGAAAVASLPRSSIGADALSAKAASAAQHPGAGSKVQSPAATADASRPSKADTEAARGPSPKKTAGGESSPKKAAGAEAPVTPSGDTLPRKEVADGAGTSSVPKKALHPDSSSPTAKQLPQPEVVQGPTHIEEEVERQALQAEAENLRSKLRAIELERQIAEAHVEELQLELEEVELSAAEAAAAKEARKKAKEAPQGKLGEYQAAIQALHKTSSQEKGRLESRLKDLEQHTGAKARLKKQVEDLMHRKIELEARISSLDKYGAELSKLTEAGAALEDAQASATAELRRELELCDGRVAQLEELVQKVDKDRLQVERATAEEVKKAADLTAQLKQWVGRPEDSQDVVSAKTRICAADVRRQLCALGEASSSVCAKAYVDCLPSAWTGTSSSSTSTGSNLDDTQKCIAAAEVSEKCVALADAICRAALSRLRSVHSSDAGSKTADQCYKLSLDAGRCAAALSTLLSLGSALPKVVGDLQKLESELQKLLRQCIVEDQDSATLFGGLQTTLQKVLLLGASSSAEPNSRYGVMWSLQRLEAAYLLGIAKQAKSEKRGAQGTLQTLTGVCDQLASLVSQLHATWQTPEKPPDLDEILAQVEDKVQQSPEDLKRTLAEHSSLLLAMIGNMAAEVRHRGVSHAGTSKLKSECFDCSLEVQKRVNHSFVQEQEVVEAQKELDKRKAELSKVEEELAASATRTKELQLELDDMQKRAEEELHRSEEVSLLREKAKEASSRQAELDLELETVQEQRQATEEELQTSQSGLVSLQSELTDKQRNPTANQPGKVTASELAMLRRSSRQAARDIYAMKVAEVLSLPPIPLAQHHGSAVPALGKCLSKHGELRRELLMESAGARIVNLQAPGNSCEKMTATAQRLQMELAALQGQLLTLLPSDNASTAMKGGIIGTPVVQLQVTVPCPTWSGLTTSKESQSINLRELTGIHAVVL